MKEVLFPLDLFILLGIFYQKAIAFACVDSFLALFHSIKYIRQLSFHHQKTRTEGQVGRERERARKSKRREYFYYLLSQMLL